MLLSKNQLFGIVFGLILIPFFLNRVIWIAQSSTTIGKMRFMGKTINGQLTSTYPVISFSSTGKDTVWFNGQDDLVYTPGQPVPVRYLQHDPTDARINTLYSLWIDVLIIAGVPCLMVLLIYLHRSIFPKGTKFLIGKKPFFQVIPVEGS